MWLVCVLAAAGVLLILYRACFGGGISKRKYHPYQVPDRSVKDTIKSVAAKKAEWSSYPDSEKLKILKEIRARVFQLIPEYAEAEAKVRNVTTDASKELKAEQYQLGPAFFGLTINTLINVYESLVATGKPPPPLSVRQNNGQTVATTWPRSVKDKILASGMVQEVYVENLNQGGVRSRDGGVCGILGAGNFSVPCDILTKMFVENKVCVYKPHPNNVPVIPIMLNVMAPLLRGGWLAFIDQKVTSELTDDPLIDELLMTGGCKTYDAIMWGRDADKAKNSNTPRITKHMDAELGGVGPVIIVPGDWTDKEIDRHAAALALYKQVNSGFICASPQIVIMADTWSLRKKFEDRVAHFLRTIHKASAYYSGADQRCDAFKAKYPQAEVMKQPGNPSHKFIEPLFIRDIDAQTDEYVIKEEAFFPMLGTTTIPYSGDVEEYMKNASMYVNEKVFGSLCATVVIDDKTKQANADAFDAMIANMEYGTIGVNIWGGFENFYPMGTWGAFPGKHTSKDIQSGVGIILNFSLFDKPIKSVLTAPFVADIQPQLPSKPNANIQLAYYAVDQTWSRLVRLIFAALTGL